MRAVLMQKLQRLETMQRTSSHELDRQRASFCDLDKEHAGLSDSNQPICAQYSPRSQDEEAASADTALHLKLHAARERLKTLDLHRAVLQARLSDADASSEAASDAGTSTLSEIVAREATLRRASAATGAGECFYDQICDIAEQREKVAVYIRGLEARVGSSPEQSQSLVAPGAPRADAVAWRNSFALDAGIAALAGSMAPSASAGCDSRADVWQCQEHFIGSELVSFGRESEVHTPLSPDRPASREQVQALQDGIALLTQRLESREAASTGQVQQLQDAMLRLTKQLEAANVAVAREEEARKLAEARLNDMKQMYNDLLAGRKSEMAAMDSLAELERIRMDDKEPKAGGPEEVRLSDAFGHPEAAPRDAKGRQLLADCDEWLTCERRTCSQMSTAAPVSLSRPTWMKALNHGICAGAPQLSEFQKQLEEQQEFTKRLAEKNAHLELSLQRLVQNFEPPQDLELSVASSAELACSASFSSLCTHGAADDDAAQCVARPELDVGVDEVMHEKPLPAMRVLVKPTFMQRGDVHSLPASPPRGIHALGARTCSPSKPPVLRRAACRPAGAKVLPGGVSTGLTMSGHVAVRMELPRTPSVPDLPGATSLPEPPCAPSRPRAPSMGSGASEERHDSAERRVAIDKLPLASNAGELLVSHTFSGEALE